MSAEWQVEASLAAFGLASAARQRLAGDVSHRRYYRLRGAGLDGTAVLMVTPPEEAPKLHDWIAVGQWLHDQGVPVPRVLQRDDASCCLLVSDVGDLLLTEVTAPEDCYHQVLTDLARAEVAGGGSPAHARRLDEIRIRWELRRFRKVVAAPLRDLDDYEAALWKLGEDRLVAGLTGGPLAWMHRDLHSRNLLVQDGQVWWIDFQDAMLGPWLYDLVSLLYDPYAALSAAQRGAWREFYLGLPGRVHPGQPAAAVEQIWSTVAVQRLVHCIACYVWVFEHHGRDTYLRYLPFALEHLRAELARCAAAAPLARVLEPRWDGLIARWSRDAVEA